MTRITGNSSGSLGLHPAVYFYSHRGKHSQHLFLAVTSLIAKKVRANNKEFFKTFTNVRVRLEQCLIRNKPILGQAIVQIGSSQRVPRLTRMLESFIEVFKVDGSISPDDLLKFLKLEGKLLASDLQASKTAFSKETKSEIFLKNSIQNALPCPICRGLVDPNKSISFDHILHVRDGGKGESDNGQITHPYCNSGIKN